MIFWPCILKLAGDNELIYLSSPDVFVSESKQIIFHDDDYIIDSNGHCFLIETILNTHILPSAYRVMLIEEVTALIRAHEFNKASLCLTKIYFSTVSEAVNSLNY